MSENKYEVHKKWIDEAEFEVLILKIPVDELDDKLAYLARDEGNITKVFYNDFVMATCVANVNTLIYMLKRNPQRVPDMGKVREQILEYIFEINPDLLPDNLIINRNSVVKLKGDRELGEDERLLSDNKYWDTSYYDEILDQYGVDPNSPALTILEEEDLVGKHPPVEDDRSVSDLKYNVMKKWWGRLNTYVKVKAFKEEDAAVILTKRLYHNKPSFETYIVSTCVVDADDLVVMLDQTGLSTHTPPQTLLTEIFKLCESVNPFLNYETAKLFIEDIDDDLDYQRPSKPNRRSNTMSSHVSKKNGEKAEKQKLFRDVTKAELLNLGNEMKGHLIGQDEAVDGLVEAVQRASVGLKDPARPIGSFMFAGRTGVGKTLATKILADKLINEHDSLVTVDCSEYSADHEYAKLIGAPAGYIGHETGGFLTNAMAKNPFAVVVFDEVEKASQKVHELLLQILEEGRLTDGKGQHVSFKDAVVILTSNIGVAEVDSIKSTVGFGDVAKITNEKKDKAIDKAIKKKFRPELINRLDAIINFKTLTKADYMRIIDLELYKLNDNLKNNDTEYKTLQLEFDKKVRNLIFKHGIDSEYGARPLRRTIEKEVSTPLAMKLLREDIDPESKVKIGAYKGKATFKIDKVEKEVEAEAATAVETETEVEVIND